MTAESWFLLALLSAVAAGFEAFMHKVVAMRDGDIRALSTVSSFISSIILAIATLIFSGFGSLWTLASVLACAGAGTYLLTLVFKVEALKSIDSAIFFPLYKVAGPSLAIIFGIVFFSESFSAKEWLGLLLGMTIPFLLITKTEERRQKNLTRGLVMLAVASLAGSVSIALFKSGAVLASNVWQYVLISEVFLFISSALTPLKQHGALMGHYVLSQVRGRNLPLVLAMGAAQVTSTAGIIFAFSSNGLLGIVYTVNSLSMLVPIALSAIIFREHLSIRKIIAIVISIMTVALLG